jgi:hypothetical protein
MIVNIKKRTFNKCERFAVKRVTGSSDLYAYRGEPRKEKLVNDILVGALGEWAVEAHLASMGYECTEPDMKIYKTRGKSFDADLYVDDIEIHVKSQGMVSVKRYGNSWLLQRNDKIVSEPKENQLFAFTNVDVENRIVDILGYCWAKDMVYGECKVWAYKKTKVAIYLKDIEDFLVEY